MGRLSSLLCVEQRFPHKVGYSPVREQPSPHKVGYSRPHKVSYSDPHIIIPSSGIKTNTAGTRYNFRASHTKSAHTHTL